MQEETYTLWKIVYHYEKQDISISSCIHSTNKKNTMSYSFKTNPALWCTHLAAKLINISYTGS